jgi:hypothetical protein
MIDGEGSILPIVSLDNHTDWSSVYEVADKVARSYLDHRGLARLIAALNSTAKCIAVEREYIDKDFRDTFSNFHSKRFSTPDSRCLRLHFFDRHISRVELREASSDEAGQRALNQSYLGYSVIRPTKPNCIGRTFLTPASRGPASAYAALCEEKVSILGTELRVTGFPFISQDVDVTVCAESAVWMILRYFSNRYALYPETYPFQVVSLTRDFSFGQRNTPSAGLYVWQMADALRKIGRSPVTYNRKRFSDFEHLMYTYIESGIPVLACTRDHVVVAFGHRSNFAVQLPQQDRVFSSIYNEAFVINDDNFVPYQILQQTGAVLSSGAQASRYNFSDIVDFIAPLPEKVFLPAESFQTVVTAILEKSPTFGFRVLSPKLQSKQLVLRLFLTTGKSFKKHLAKRKMGSLLVEEAYMNLPLPHFVWVCEISEVDAYSRHEVHGEILWDATRNAKEPNGWIALHYPEVLVVDMGSALNKHQDLYQFRLTDSSPYPAYKNNLQEI